MGRVQLYLDVSIDGGGGGVKPDGTPTPRVDEAYYLAHLTDFGTGLVLDPSRENRWAIQCALRDAFGWDGKADPNPAHLQRLRDLAAAMTYIPPMRVKRVVVVDRHADCPYPHGED